LLALCLLVTLSFDFLPSRYAVNAGDVSPYDVKSPVKVTYLSQIQTADERQRAAGAVPDSYRPIPDSAAKAQASAVAALAQITQIRGSSVPDASKIDQLTRLGDLGLSAAVATTLLSLDDVEWQSTQTATLNLVGRMMRGRITPQQLGAVRAMAPAQLDPGLSDAETTVVTALARGLIVPTEEVDQAATDAARKAAADQVPPVQVTIEKGETILRNGDVVTALDVERLNATGLRNPAIRWSELVSSGLLSIALVGFLVAFLSRFQRTIGNHPRRLLLLGILVVAPVLAAKLTIPGHPFWAYLFPIAAAPMLMTILLGVEISLVGTGIQAIALGLVGGDLELVAATVIAGGLAALMVHRVERLDTLTLAGALVAAANFAVITAFQLTAGDVDAQRLALYGGLALLSGALSAALTLGTVSFLGHVFGIPTTMNLLELAHPSQPLFRRLLTEAPGTYHHSVVVANLAERATEVVGGDTLLARIGGYYHDIGKLGRPYAFVENQVSGENIHDQLDAYTSAHLIVSHVTDGLELATRHGIPYPVRDIIAQHHGTMLVQYFYRQACQGAGGPVDEAPFRYPGPRPRSREAAIIMLADGVEATVRSCRDHSPENVAQVVDRVFQERISGGQLDECDLTLADLQKVRSAFLSVLQGIFHPRIAYPAPTSPEPNLVGTST
jgi:putative nucleotidyltransferase with HDIG domain